MNTAAEPPGLYLHEEILLLALKDDTRKAGLALLYSQAVGGTIIADLLLARERHVALRCQLDSDAIGHGFAVRVGTASRDPPLRHPMEVSSVGLLAGASRARQVGPRGAQGRVWIPCGFCSVNELETVRVGLRSDVYATITNHVIGRSPRCPDCRQAKSHSTREGRLP